MRPDRSAVLLIVHRRPERLARVMARIRESRPERLIVAADVPVEGPDEPDHVEALRIATDIDWPCDVSVDVAPRPLGCSARIVSALDHGFEQVDRLIVVEDDIVVDPTFLDWADLMLDRYSAHPDVGQVGGRNELVRWPVADGQDLMVRRGSVWGWATWRHVWQRHRNGPRLAAPPGDSLVHRHLSALHTAPGTTLVWDVEWGRFLGCAGLKSIVPPVNLVDNIGFGDGATHTVDTDDLRARFPTASSLAGTTRFAAEHPNAGAGETGQSALDPDTYDEWALLIGLMASYRRPDAVARMARMTLGRDASPFDERTMHHLEPFQRIESSLQALDHLRRHGVDGPRLTRLTETLQVAARERVVSAGDHHGIGSDPT